MQSTPNLAVRGSKFNQELGQMRTDSKPKQMPMKPESLVETGSPHVPHIMNNQEPTVAPSMLKQVNKAALEEVRESTESANAKMHMSFGMLQQNMLSNSGKNAQN